MFRMLKRLGGRHCEISGRTRVPARAQQALAVSLVLLVPAAALAYPSSIVFSPNGECKAFGTLGLLGYGAVNVKPTVSPGSSWFGIQAGLLPQWKYGDSG